MERKVRGNVTTRDSWDRTEEKRNDIGGRR